MSNGKIKMLIGSIRRKPNNAPDRKSDAQAGPAPEKKTSLIHDLTHMKWKDRTTLFQAFQTMTAGEPMDDKDLLLEHGVSMLQGLPLNSGLSSTVSDGFIKLLYHDLPHPASTIAGPEGRYRRHDGGGNNPWLPEMGKAGSPYSRSVPPMKPKGPNLPDPELVFEQLLRRKPGKNGEFREHPSGLNRLFFSFATIVIHECFQTNRKQQWINDTSSYVDLSTLYGNTGEEQKRVRMYENGRIYPDAIASERIMLMPPGVIALLIMFSRNHNSIAESLLSVNEQGKYGEWSKLSPDQQKWQDEDIFQLSRNINVGFFASVVLHDYVAAILNTPRANSEWSLDLGKEIKSGIERVERGTGNVVSVEFAVLYHWHAALSAADAEWMEEFLNMHFPGKSIESITPEDFYKGLVPEVMKLLSPENPAKQWTFYSKGKDFKRGADGKFDDVQLAELIKDCINEPAHAFGAHGTPASLKIVDIMGQLQAREVFNVCTMNEFRRYLNLKAYDSFEEWNPDKETARAAELLYGHIENLELYPGLMAECTKPPIPGSGVCPGQTTGRGILDDAVALVRGDRFLSYDFNSNTLTNWGVGKLSETVPGSYGGTMPALIYAGLPGGFTGTSSWGLLPFYTPKAAEGILKGNKALDQYDTTRPASDRAVIAVHTSQGCKRVLEDKETFRITLPPILKDCAGGADFMLGSVQSGKTSRHQTLEKAFFEDGFEKNVIKFFGEATIRMIKESSLKYPTNRRSLDVVRDITNIVPIMWVAKRFAVPLKTMEQPKGLYTIPRLFEVYQVLNTYLTFNVIPSKEWKLRATATADGGNLRAVLDQHLKTQQGFKERVVDWMEKGSAYEVGPDADRLFHALNSTKAPTEELVGDLIGMSAPLAGIITQQAALLVDLFLTEQYDEYKQNLVQLAQKDDVTSWAELQNLVRDAMRHANVVAGLPRVAAKDTVIEDGARGPIKVKAHQTVLIATSKAAMDPAAFLAPEKLNTQRPREDYSLLGGDSNFSRVAIPALSAMLKEIFKLKDIGRAQGRRGNFTILEHDVAGVSLRSYLDSNAKESPVPTSLNVEYKE